LKSFDHFLGMGASMKVKLLVSPVFTVTGAIPIEGADIMAGSNT
jgi:hypothetical protein